MDLSILGKNVVLNFYFKIYLKNEKNLKEILKTRKQPWCLGLLTTNFKKILSCSEVKQEYSKNSLSIKEQPIAFNFF